MVVNILIVEVLGYVLALIIAMLISKKVNRKNDHFYYKSKPFLIFLNILVFLHVSMILFESALVFQLSVILFVLNILFIIYFFTFTFRNDRIWSQRRLIIYNILILPALSVGSLLIENPDIHFFSLYLLTYTIIEFQFAKFDLKKDKLIY